MDFFFLCKRANLTLEGLLAPWAEPRPWTWVTLYTFLRSTCTTDGVTVLPYHEFYITY